MSDIPSSTPRNNGKAEANGFSRRERQIMDALYVLGRASAAQIHQAIPDAPSYTAVRTLLTILEKKGHVRHEAEGVRYLYEPVAAREDAGKRAMRTLKSTFYDGSVERLVAALLTEEDIAPGELDRLAQLIDKARKEGR